MAIAVIHDPSDVGRAALAVAFEDANLRDTEVVVLHALSGSHAGEHDQAESTAVHAAVEAAIADTPGTWTVEFLRPQSDAVTAVVDRLGSGDITRVVVGSRHRSAVGKLLLGRDVQRLLLESPVTVVLAKLDE